MMSANVLSAGAPSIARHKAKRISKYLIGNFFSSRGPSNARRSDARCHNFGAWTLKFLGSLVLGGWMFFLAPSLLADDSQTNAAREIVHQLESFRQLGSVLYIAAHPDDENTELLAYLSRGRDYRTAYLSLTRGDGGQNVLGPDFGEKLGVARTQELLAARRIDGARQYFSRAMDFGFSKDYRETLRIWDEQGVLSDMVRVIREFRPDILVTRFSPVPGGTHGHHTASTVLALEAFKLAGDPKAFPEQGLEPWQPQRILWNTSSFQRGQTVSTNQVRINAGGVDSVSGESFADIAGQSRSMHKTQGFGNYKIRAGGGEARYESFQLLDGSPVTNDILDGIDPTWNRFAGGAAIGTLTDDLIAKFNPQNPAASVPALLKLRSLLAALPAKDSVVAEKRLQLDRILQACLGLDVQVTMLSSEVVPGESLRLHHSAIIHSKIPITWLAARYPVTKGEDSQSIDLRANVSSTWNSTQTLPANTLLTQPYWLRAEGTAGMFRVDDAALIGTPENAPAFPIEEVFAVGGQTLVVPTEPLEIRDDSLGRETRRRLDVIPPVSLHFISDITLFAPGKTNAVTVEITASRNDSDGTLRLETPAGWTVAPADQAFHLVSVGDKAKFTFTVTAPAQAATAKIIASAEIDGVRYRNARSEINYAHIPPQLLQPLASVKAISLDLATRGHTIGYLSGAGDSVAENLTQMGYTVKTLTGADLTAEQLHGLDAVVIGVRAFNVRDDLAAQMPALFTYVENGGTIIAQYNRPDGLKVDKLAPYDLHLSGDRVTDETAEMTFLAPTNPVLNTPNKITKADFDGWVQERGIYFPNQWDDHFTPIFANHDPGEAPLKGSLLVAQYGKGYYVYTGLDFFRELPAGVPGAYRLFANLISLGK
jgi:LmbE family N-acetylglucosaminyl deacetylase